MNLQTPPCCGVSMPPANIEDVVEVIAAVDGENDNWRLSNCYRYETELCLLRHQNKLIFSWQKVKDMNMRVPRLEVDGQKRH